MINSITKFMNEYAQAYKQINDVYLQAKKHCDETYVKSSPMYKNTLNVSLNARTKALMPIMKETKENLSKAITEAKRGLQKVFTKQPSMEQLQLIKMVQNGSYSETEKNMFLASVRNNYLATKMMYEAFGMTFVSPLDDLLESIENIEQITSTHFNEDGTPSSSYNSRLLMQGDYISGISSRINDFINTYSDQEGDNNV